MFRVFLVEDNPADAVMVEEVLLRHKLSFTLEHHFDADEALQAIAAAGWTRPDIILLDLGLPRRGGFELLREIKNRPSLVGIPVGILTASADYKYMHRAALLGVERYILKPGTLGQFVAEVGEAILDMLGLSGQGAPAA